MEVVSGLVLVACPCDARSAATILPPDLAHIPRARALREAYGPATGDYVGTIMGITSRVCVFVRPRYRECVR